MSEADRLDRAARSLRAEALRIGECMAGLRGRFDHALHASNASWQGPSADRMFQTIDARNGRIQGQRAAMERLAGNMERAARAIRSEDQEARRRAAAAAG